MICRCRRTHYRQKALRRISQSSEQGIGFSPPTKENLCLLAREWGAVRDMGELPTAGPLPSLKPEFISTWQSRGPTKNRGSQLAKVLLQTFRQSGRGVVLRDTTPQ